MRPLLTATQRTPPRASQGVPIVQPPGGHAIYLVRLAIPRRVYTQSHSDYVVEVILEVWNHRAQIPGVQLSYEAPFLAPLNRSPRTGESRNGHTCVSCARECGERKNSRVPHSSVAAFATLEPALRVCDFFKIAKNQRCKQYSYGDKTVEKSRKSQTLSEAEGVGILTFDPPSQWN